MRSIVEARWVKYTRFARALQSRPFALLWTGQTISALGDGAFTLALAWQVLLLTGSAALMSIVVIVKYIPMLLFLLLGGVAADRLQRRLVMLYSDAGRAFVVLLIACLGWFHLLQFWHLTVLSFLFGLVNSFFNPAYQALPAQLVEVEDLPSANALKGLSSQASTLFGPLLGAGSVSLGGPMFAFAFDGLTFVISAFCIWAIRQPDGQRPQSDAPGGSSRVPVPKKRGFRDLLKDIHEGISYIGGTRWLWVSISIASVANIGMAGPLTIVLPKLIRDSYGEGVWLLGFLVTVSGIGSIVAAIFIGQRQRLRRRGVLAYGSLVACSTSLIILGLPLPHFIRLITALAANVMFGFGLGTFEIIWVTLLQELVPSDKLGRVSSVDMLGSLCLLPLGYALAGTLADRVGPGWVFILGGSMNLVLAGVALSVRDIRCLE